MPTVTVLMSVYNGERYLAETLESVRSQTFADHERVAVDDCSTDDSPRLLAEAAAADPRVRVVTNPENLGLPRSLNRGLAQARGRYLARLDADDRCLPRRLERQVEVLDTRPEVGVLGTSVRFIDADGKPTGALAVDPDHTTLTARLLLGNPLVHPSVMTRTARLREVGGYSEDPGFRFAEDWELWTRLARVTQLAGLPEELLEFRRWESLSAVHGDDVRRCGHRVALRACRDLVSPEDLDGPAFERFYRAYSYRRLEGLEADDLAELAPLFRAMRTLPGAHPALSRRLGGLAARLSAAGRLRLGFELGRVAMGIAAYAPEVGAS